MNPRRVRIKRQRCGACGVLEGQFHVPGCDMEICPFCRGQLLSCDCVYERLGLVDQSRYGPETAHLPPEIYEKGLTEAQAMQWDALLRQQGLIPFILWPVHCAMCGLLWPDFFRVPDEEWKTFIPQAYQRAVICRLCYDGLVADIQSHKSLAVVFPDICVKCGCGSPEPFTVAEEERARYIHYPIHMEAAWQKVLCKPCYDFIRHVIDLEHEPKKRPRPR